MLTKFWESVSEQLAGRWMATLFAPAFVFWGYGLLTWVWHTGWTQALTRFQQLSDSDWWVVIVGGLFVVLFSALIVQSLVLPVLRLLEGYLPDWLACIRTPLVRRQHRRIERLRQRYDAIAESEVDRPLTRVQREQLLWLDEQLRQAPRQPDDTMPTRLGNVLRAAEQLPNDKYGLDAIICWSRLWLLLPDTARQELSAARASLDMAVQVIIWGCLLVVWTVWTWWSPLVAVLVIWFAHRRALSTAGVYGDLLESAFDLYRMRLYESLCLPKPTNPAEERAMGTQLTRYLYRGLLDETVTFMHTQDG